MVNNNYAGVCREGAVRVTGSGSKVYGAVEICINGTWGAICTGNWDSRDASVMCRQLGHSPYGKLNCAF